MAIIIGWQVSVAISILIARVFFARAMTAVAFCWTIFTLLAVWANWLVLVQLGTAWGTVWLLQTLAGHQDNKNKLAADAREQAEEIARSSNPKPKRKDTSAESNLPLVKSSAQSPATPTSTNKSKVMPYVNEVLSDFTMKLEVQREKQEANSDLFLQLYGLRIYVESVLQSADARKATSNRLAEDSQFAEIYRRLEKTLRDGIGATGSNEFNDKPTSFSLTMEPVQREDLPGSAIEERQKKLKEVLDVLENTHTRLDKDRVLLAAAEAKSPERLLPFLIIQIELLNQHLAYLSRSEAQRPTPAGPGVVAAKNAAWIDVFASVAMPAGKDHQQEREINRDPFIQHLKQIQADEQPGKVFDHSPKVDTWEGITIEMAARELRIPHLVHFTRCENLPNILLHGLMSVNMCQKKGIARLCNDLNRYDAQPEGTSLSIAFPNYRMFWKYRQLMPQADWVVLLIAPQVLRRKDCAFYRHNAADARMIRQPREEMKSVQALRDMFSAEDGARESWLRSYDPTDIQAEVMMYDVIEPRLVEAIAFENAEVRARHLHYLAGHESFYAGSGKGLFASRKRTRMS